MKAPFSNFQDRLLNKLTYHINVKEKGRVEVLSHAKYLAYSVTWPNWVHPT